MKKFNKFLDKLNRLSFSMLTTSLVFYKIKIKKALRRHYEKRKWGFNRSK